MNDKNIPCLSCEDSDDCNINKVLNNTLDNKKEHKLLTLTIKVLATVEDSEEFKSDFNELCSQPIAEGSAALSTLVEELLYGIECITSPLGADLSVASITNKDAFTALTEYIKVSHSHG